jgi:hypothetical protein
VQSGSDPSFYLPDFIKDELENPRSDSIFPAQNPYRESTPKDSNNTDSGEKDPKICGLCKTGIIQGD